LDHAACQQGWSGRRLRCEVSSPSSSPVACCWSSKEVCGVVAPISPCGVCFLPLFVRVRSCC
jgi:hypothetical protein